MLVEIFLVFLLIFCRFSVDNLLFFHHKKVFLTSKIAVFLLKNSIFYISIDKSGSCTIICCICHSIYFWYLICWKTQYSIANNMPLTLDPKCSLFLCRNTRVFTLKCSTICTLVERLFPTEWTTGKTELICRCNKHLHCIATAMINLWKKVLWITFFLGDF